MTGTVRLPGVPGLGGLYARGLAGAARAALPGRRAPHALPEVTYAADGVRVDADHLTRYQRLVHETASDALPAGYVHVLAFPVATALMVRDDFPLPLLGLVHVSNHVTQARPLHLGDVLDVRARAQGLRPHRAGTVVDLVTEVAADGEVAWRGVSSYLAKGVRLVDGPADEPDRPAFVPPVRTGRWELAADTGRRYAAVSGDVNPIHLSTATARLLGFRRAIAHGMLTASRALADVGAGRGDAFTWDVEFASPVLLPASVDVRVAREGDGHRFTAWSPRSGRLHLQGEVRPHA